MHPMEAKIALGKLIVDGFPLGCRRRSRRRDLQPRGAPQGSARRHRQPSRCPKACTKDGAIRVDKLLAQIGLAESVSDAVRKIKAGAVEINGEKVKDLALAISGPELVIQVGKNWRRVTVSPV